MDININLEEKLNGLSKEMKYLAKKLLSEVERGRKSISQIEELIIDEIRDIVAGEE